MSAASIPAIVVPAGLRPFVARAAADVADDIRRIFGTRPQILPSAPPGGNAIVLAESGAGWENYAVESRPGNVLEITGSDSRGVMFGLYRFASDCLGVDPFRFWSGREPPKSRERTWDRISIRQGDPSFRFRGWFINDEDFLNGFRPEENGRREIDYPRYHACFGTALMDAICETALRAGFNTIVCASYVDILNPDERRLVDVASSRGLFITTHHQEPVGAGARQLDLHFPEIRGTTYASHPGLWRKAWRTYIAEWAKVPDVIWQLGLRGRGDLPFWTEPGAAPRDGGEAEDRRRAALVSRAMSEQLGIIREVLGRRPEHFATQLWLESSEFHRRGLLSVPEGTIVMFSDNSPGLKFQGDLCAAERLDTSRRFGLYYHLAIVHGNHRCELVPPSRTRQVLGDAWGRGARELLLVNVSNVRPFLYTLEAMGEMARGIGGFDAAAFRDRWATARFGAAAAHAAARAIDLYFAAYETEPSRDAASSYGSPRPRAPLAILHDGELCKGARLMAAALVSPERAAPPPVSSQYDEDPDRLAEIGGDLFRRTKSDMLPSLADPARAGIRARAQSAAFARCLEQLRRAAAGLDRGQRRQLFERFGYPAEFMRLSSDIFAELSAATEAKALGDDACARRHVRAALAHGRRRDALDARYNAGKWARWYDRDLVYPCHAVMAELSKHFKP